MVEIRQVGKRVEPLTVFRDGDRVWEEDFLVSVYEDGEIALSIETMDQWEERHQHYLKLAESGLLPEPTAISPERQHPRGEPATAWTDSVLKPLVVYRAGNQIWREEFLVTVDEDGEVLLSHLTSLELKARQKHYLKLAKEGKLPEPSETGAKGSHEAAGG